MKSLLKLAGPAITLSLVFANNAKAAFVSSLDNGTLCLQHAQCISGACVKPYGSGLAFCMPKAAQGEGCSFYGSTNVSAKPMCESGLTCINDMVPTGIKLPDNTGWCSDPNDDCPTCGALLRVDSAAAGYDNYMRGLCGSSCGTWVSSLRCSSGYYGIGNSTDPTTAPSCTKCPENGKCYAEYNETFYCNLNYYKTDTECIRCPTFAVDNYGQTEYVFNKGGIETCYASAGGPYIDATGTFEYLSKCPY